MAGKTLRTLSASGIRPMSERDAKSVLADLKDIGKQVPAVAALLAEETPAKAFLMAALSLSPFLRDAANADPSLVGDALSDDLDAVVEAAIAAARPFIASPAPDRKQHGLGVHGKRLSQRMPHASGGGNRRTCRHHAPARLVHFYTEPPPRPRVCPPPPRWGGAARAPPPPPPRPARSMTTFARSRHGSGARAWSAATSSASSAQA